MYSKLPNLVIAFHGCDQTVFDRVILQHEHLKSSSNGYDWLGSGIYFWEQNLERAWQWAKDGANSSHSSIKNPAVIGAVIDLGRCLNLTDSSSAEKLKNQYEIFKAEMELLGQPLPENKNTKGNTDMRIRKLDCAVIDSLHAEIKRNGEPPYDSVRGIFFEGDPIYEGSGFRERTHIQLCIRNPNCIKGYFAPLKEAKEWEMP